MKKERRGKQHFHQSWSLLLLACLTLPLGSAWGSRAWGCSSQEHTGIFRVSTVHPSYMVQATCWCFKAWFLELVWGFWGCCPLPPSSPLPRKLAWCQDHFQQMSVCHLKWGQFKAFTREGEIGREGTFCIFQGSGRLDKSPNTKGRWVSGNCSVFKSLRKVTARATDLFICRGTMIFPQPSTPQSTLEHLYTF